MRERDGYYSWRHPVTKEEYGLGRDRRDAMGQAIEMNMKLAGEIVRPRLVDRVGGAEDRTWARWCDEFEALLAERDAKPNTIRTRKSQMVRLRRSFSGPAAKVGTLEVSVVLKAIKAEGKNRSAQAFRSFLIDCFDRMIAQGWRSDNPARVTDEVRVKVKRSRLTLSLFEAVYKRTQLQWLRNAMALALVAGKDRDSVRNAQFSDFRDGGWWNERSKTEARVFLPLELRLDCFDMSLEDVLRQCRSTGIVSRYLVHQTQRAKGAVLGKPIHPDMITRRFSAEVDALGLDWGEKEAPTFHEIRSLAARLYAQQGNINPQELLSHKDPRSTAMYTDGRGEWVHLKVPK
jgi:enterobacteria phage integrase